MQQSTDPTKSRIHAVPFACLTDILSRAAIGPRSDTTVEGCCNKRPLGLALLDFWTAIERAAIELYAGRVGIAAVQAALRTSHLQQRQQRPEVDRNDEIVILSRDGFEKAR